MSEAVLLILGMLALTGLASFIDIGEAEDDDPDREGPMNLRTASRKLIFSN